MAQRSKISGTRAAKSGLFLLHLLFVILALDSVAIAVVFDPMDPATVYGDNVNYTIYRNGKPIGKHAIQFLKSDDNLRVEIESNLVVRVLKIPIYRFNYKSEEHWTNGALQSVDISVKEKGKLKQLGMLREGQSSIIYTSSGDTAHTIIEYSSNHWHPGVLDSDVIFNTLTGKPDTVEVTNLGNEDVQIDGQSMSATRYHYGKALQTDVWYDKVGRWVKLSFKARDGSLIEYRSNGFNIL